MLACVKGQCTYHYNEVGYSEDDMCTEGFCAVVSARPMSIRLIV